VSELPETDRGGHVLAFIHGVIVQNKFFWGQVAGTLVSRDIGQYVFCEEGKPESSDATISHTQVRRLKFTGGCASATVCSHCKLSKHTPST
jgi:hypothetical protein